MKHISSTRKNVKGNKWNIFQKSFLDISGLVYIKEKHCLGVDGGGAFNYNSYTIASIWVALPTQPFSFPFVPAKTHTNTPALLEAVLSWYFYFFFTSLHLQRQEPLAASSRVCVSHRDSDHSSAHSQTDVNVSLTERPGHGDHSTASIAPSPGALWFVSSTLGMDSPPTPRSNKKKNNVEGAVGGHKPAAPGRLFGIFQASQQRDSRPTYFADCDRARSSIIRWSDFIRSTFAFRPFAPEPARDLLEF